MRNGVLRGTFAALAVVVGLTMTACGGDDSERRRTTVDWEPSSRRAQHSQRWWWEPVERHCEEDEDCRQGERCQPMQLATCAECPQGETAHVCVGREGQQRQASKRR